MGTLYWRVAILVTRRLRMVMPTAFRRFGAAWSLALLPAVFAPGTAHALDGDRIRPSIGVVGTYYSNLFYLDDRQPVGAFLKNGQRSDFSYGLRGGIAADYYFGRQFLTINGTATQSQFQTYGNLDNVAYNGRAALNWVIGSDWSGDLGGTYNENLGSFADVRTNQKNLRTAQTLFGSALYRVYYDWSLRAALTQTTLENSAINFRQGNQDITVYEFGTRYYSKGGDSFLGLNFKNTDGKFPNRVDYPTERVDSSYYQRDLQGTVDWRYSGETRLSGAVGWTNRQHEQLSQRNFTGVTGRVTLSYAYSGKTAINTTLRRDIGALDDVTSNFILTQGFNVGPSYALSGKVTLTASYDYSQRKFLGDPGFIVTHIPVRVDNIQSVNIGVQYTPARNVSISANLSQAVRSSNRPLSDFSATTLTVTGQVTF